MYDYIVQNLWLFWSVVTIVCLIMELTSGDFYVTCFALGAAVSVVAALVGTPFWLQVLLWAIFSVLSVMLVRPHLVKALRKGADHRKSNADALIGQIGEVSETIKRGDFGRVKLDGDDWKAESPTSVMDIAEGTKVRVEGRESIILSVEPI